MGSIEDLGPDDFPLQDLARIARDCLETRAFICSSVSSDNAIVLQAERKGWARAITGRRLAVILRIEKNSGRWRAELKKSDWQSNLSFFLASSLLGPLGWSAASLSIASRLFADNEREEILEYLRSCVNKEKRD